MGSVGAVIIVCNPQALARNMVAWVHFWPLNAVSQNFLCQSSAMTATKNLEVTPDKVEPPMIKTVQGMLLIMMSDFWMV